MNGTQPAISEKSPRGTSFYLWVAVLVILGVALGGFYSHRLMSPLTAPTPSGGGIVRVGSFSTAIDYAPLIVARSKGWINEALQPLKFHAEYETFQTLAPINEALASKRVDLVFEAEPPAIVARAAGIDVRVIAMSGTVDVQGIVPAASLIKSVAELRGKRVAVLFGSGAHYGLMRDAQLANLGAGDFQTIDMVPPDAKAAFDSGQLDAWMVWPPWSEQEVAQNRARFLPGANTPVHSLLVARNELLQQHPEVAQAMVGAIDRAKAWIAGNPQEAERIVAAELKLPINVVELAWPRHDWGARFSDAVISDIQLKGEFLVQLKFLKQSVDVRKDLIVPMGTSK